MENYCIVAKSNAVKMFSLHGMEMHSVLKSIKSYMKQCKRHWFL